MYHRIPLQFSKRTRRALEFIAFVGGAGLISYLLLLPRF